MTVSRKIAYFSMEIGLQTDIPTYSGGLGILAGDSLHSAADLEIPLVAITLLYRKGHFHQVLKPDGTQIEEPVHWKVEDMLTETKPQASIEIEGRQVRIRAWTYEVRSKSGFVVPVYFLDTDVAENHADDRALTDVLYGGDNRYRICQEAILGIGGVRLLRALGYHTIKRFHMNEGHAALLTFELIQERLKKHKRKKPNEKDVKAVIRSCVFTTHTPVGAGHDKFHPDLVRSIVGDHLLFNLPEQWRHEGLFNMTYLALRLSHYVNGVAKKHAQVSRGLLSDYRIDSITNGVHAVRWTSKPFHSLYDRFIPGWREDHGLLRYAISINREHLWKAHQEAKKALLDHIDSTKHIRLSPDALTIGFARRATSYKRMDLLFRDMDRLKKLATPSRPLQLVYAGKVHPKDDGGRALIRKTHEALSLLRDSVSGVYLPDYDMEQGQLITAGVDLWLNTPEPPLEASGTSGMKAAMNGVPSLSVLDGWWIEGCVEGVTGWAIGENPREGVQENTDHADALYAKLENNIFPLFYEDREKFSDIMAQAIALNGSFFNTQRMMEQYVMKAYFK